MAESHFGILDWTVFISYFVGIFALGAAFAKRQTSTNEFFRAGKKMGAIAVMIALSISTQSAASLIGHPGRIIRSDTAVLIATYLGYLIAYPFAAYFLLPFYRKLDLTSAYEYLEKRFNLPTRLFGSALYLAQRLFWVSIVLLAPALVISVVLGIRVEFCIILIGLFATIYTALGGMAAVMWTEVAQFIVLIVGQALIVIIVALKLKGGFFEIFKIAATDGKFFGSMDWDISKPTFWTLLIGSCVTGLSFGIDQVKVQQMMTSKDERTAKNSIINQIFISIPRLGLIALIGLALYAFYKQFPDQITPELTKSPDQIVPHFVVTQLPIGVIGIVIAAICASAMSAFNAGITSLVTIFTVDWYKRIINPGQADKKYLILAKVLTVGLGLTVMLIAAILYWSGSKSIIDLSNRYFGFFLGPIIGIFMLGIFTRRAKPAATLFAGIISVVVIAVIDFLNSQRTDKIIDIYFYGVVTFAVTVILGYFGSLIGPKPDYEKIKTLTFGKKPS